MAVNKGVFSRLLSYYILSNTLTFQGLYLLLNVFWVFPC